MQTARCHSPPAFARHLPFLHITSLRRRQPAGTDRHPIPTCATRTSMGGALHLARTLQGREGPRGWRRGLGGGRAQQRLPSRTAVADLSGLDVPGSRELLFRHCLEGGGDAPDGRVAPRGSPSGTDGAGDRPWESCERVLRRPSRIPRHRTPGEPAGRAPRMGSGHTAPVGYYSSSLRTETQRSITAGRSLRSNT